MSDSQESLRPRTSARLRFVAPPGMKVADTGAKTIGRYEIIRTLGKGAMGVVYKARDPALDRIVAIKTIVSPRPGKRMHAAYIERFKREAQAAAKMQHPAIVTIYDVGIEGDAPYMVLEYLPGESLADRLDRVRLRLGKVVQIALDLASALAFAHRQRIVHRDVKPANVLHAGENRWKLADFGIARMPDSDLTQVGVFMGTPGYSPPEAIKFGHYTPQADVFAWGAVLYEMLSGRIPYEGPDTRTTNGYVIKATAPSPRKYDESIPEPLAEVVMTALSPSVTDRYKDGAAAEKALREAWELCLNANMIPGSCVAGDDVAHDQLQGPMHKGTITSVPAPQTQEQPGEAEGRAPMLVIESHARNIADDAPTQILVREGDGVRVSDLDVPGRASSASTPDRQSGPHDRQSGAHVSMPGLPPAQAEASGAAPGNVNAEPVPADRRGGSVSAPVPGPVGSEHLSGPMPEIRESASVPRMGPGPAADSSAVAHARAEAAPGSTGLSPRALFWVGLAVMLLTVVAVLVHVLTR